MAVTNTAVGGSSALQLIPGGIGLPTDNYLLLSQGTFTANGASSVTCAAAALTANSNILVTLNTVGGTVGAIPAVKTVTPGTGFTIAGTASDTSIYNYLIIG